MKSVYSVILSDELVKRLDAVAYTSGVSRSVMLNKILAVSATQIVEGRFTQASLDIELDNAAKETQYLLSLYEG